MPDCLFCQIVAGEIPAHIVAQDEHTIAFLDIHPRAPGHTVVIPKIHVPTITDLPETEVGPVFSAVRALARRLIEVLEADGLTIGINHGKVSGQEINHLHIHCMPRFFGDGGSAIQGMVNNPGTASLEEIVEKVKS